MNRRRVIVWSSIGVIVGAGAIVLTTLIYHVSREAMKIQGAVIRHDSDSSRALPIADVLITASDGATSVTARSNASGYFSLPFQGDVWPGQIVMLSFSHPDYKPLQIKLPPGFRKAAKELYIAAMDPMPEQAEADHQGPLIAITNIRVRYTVNTQTEVDIGAAVKTFQVVNKGNVPCNRQFPCSPHENWKASTGSASLDAGVDNVFRNVRASCIAGPCPFTKIDTSGFENGGRYITVSALNWSDTATFLLEAEVLHVAINSNVRESHPALFAQSLNFTLPPTAEGESLEADVDGAPMVFPLGPGPDLYLSWANCTARIDSGEEKVTVYRCELKPGYRF